MSPALLMMLRGMACAGALLDECARDRAGQCGSTRSTTEVGAAQPLKWEHLSQMPNGHMADHAQGMACSMHAMQQVSTRLVKYAKRLCFQASGRFVREVGFRAGNMVRTKSKIMTSSKTSRRRFREFRCASIGTYRDFRLEIQLRPESR